MEREAAGGSRQGFDEIRKLLSEVMSVPIAWVVAMVAFAVLSCLSLTHSDSGAAELDFAVSATTAGAVALVWLPPFLRILALTGGRLKAAGVEAAASGLLGSDDTPIDRLASIMTAAEEAERRAPQTSKALEGVDQAVDQLATEYLGGSEVINRDVVDQLAETYETLRATLPPGERRTVEMTNVVNEARLRGGADPREAASRGAELIRSKRQGERIVGLGFLRAAPARGALEDVLQLISGSATAFEMYHALHVLERLTPLLAAAEKAMAIDVLRLEQTDPRRVGIAADPSLPSVLEGVTALLESS